MFSYGQTPFPLDLNAGRMLKLDPNGGYNSDGDSRGSSRKKASSRDFVTPYSKQYAQRINQIKEQRDVKQEQRQSDIIHSRTAGRSFQVASADHTSSHHTRRSFGFIKPSFSRSPSADRGRSRSRSVDSRTSVSSSRSRSASTSRSRSGFARDLQLSRDLEAERRQQEALKQAKKEYYIKRLKAKSQPHSSTPWLPAGPKHEEMNKNSFANKALVEKVIQQKAWRRTPWAGSIPEEARQQANASFMAEDPAESSPTADPPASVESRSPKPTSQATPSSSRNLRLSIPGLSSSASALSLGSLQSLPAPARKVVLKKQSQHLALAVRIIDTHSSKSTYSILAVKRHTTKDELISSIEKQFDVKGQVSDISIASLQGYSKTVTVSSLSLGTLGDYPAIDENSDLIVYLGGALYQQGAGYEHLFSQPLRDFRTQKPKHSDLLDQDDLLFYNSISNNIQAFDEYTKTRYAHGNGDRFRDFDRKKQAYSHESGQSLGAPVLSLPVYVSAREVARRGEGQEGAEIDEPEGMPMTAAELGTSYLSSYLPSRREATREERVEASSPNHFLAMEGAGQERIVSPLRVEDMKEDNAHYSRDSKGHLLLTNLLVEGPSSPSPLLPPPAPATPPLSSSPLPLLGSPSPILSEETPAQTPLLAPASSFSPSNPSAIATLRLDEPITAATLAPLTSPSHPTTNTSANTTTTPTAQAAEAAGQRFGTLLRRLDTVYERLHKQLPKKVSEPALNAQCTFQPKLIPYSPPPKHQPLTNSMRRAELQHRERFEWKSSSLDEESWQRSGLHGESPGGRSSSRGRSGWTKQSPTRGEEESVHESFLDLRSLLQSTSEPASRSEGVERAGPETE